LGRPPIFGVAMTAAERQRRRRVKLQVAPATIHAAFKRDALKQKVMERRARLEALVPAIDPALVQQWYREAGHESRLHIPSLDHCKYVASEIRLAVAGFRSGRPDWRLGKAERYAKLLLDSMVVPRTHVQRLYQTWRDLGLSDQENRYYSNLKRLDRIRSDLCEEMRLNRARRILGSDRAQLISRIAVFTRIGWESPDGPMARRSIYKASDPICIFVAKVISMLECKQTSPRAVSAVLQRQRSVERAAMRELTEAQLSEVMHELTTRDHLD